MIANLRYGLLVLRHKWFVFLAGTRLRVPLRRLIVHDFSKFTPAEWGPYKRRFVGGRAGKWDKAADPLEFHRAWTHHWHRNAHHWEHWLRLTGDGELEPMPMPEALAREMVADWMGAGRAYTGKWGAADWYAKNRHRIQLAPDTRELVESLL